MRIRISGRRAAAVALSAALAAGLAGQPAQAAVNEKFYTTYEMDAFAGIDFPLTNRVLFDARGVKCALTAEQVSGPAVLDLSRISDTAITVNAPTLGDYTVIVYCAQYGDVDRGFTMVDLRDPHGGNILTTTYTVHVVTAGGIILNDQTYRLTDSLSDATLQSPTVAPNSSTSAPVYSVAPPVSGPDAQCSVDSVTGRLTFLALGTCVLTVSIAADGTYPAISDTAVVTVIANPYIYTVTVYGWVQQSGSKKNDKSLSAARAKAVRSYLRSQGLDAVRFVALGKGIKGRTAKARSAYVVIYWTGPTSGRVATTVYFGSSSSKISTKYKRALRVLWNRVPRD